jgi:hypothetical protein
VRTHQREEIDLQSTRKLPNRTTADLQQLQALELDFTWLNSRFRWKTERGNMRLHFYSSNTTLSGRRSQITRLDTVEAASVSGSVTARGRGNDWHADPNGQRQQERGGARVSDLGPAHAVASTEGKAAAAHLRGRGRTGRPERAFGPPGEKVSCFLFFFFFFLFFICLFS